MLRRFPKTLNPKKQVCLATVGVRHSCRDACGVIVEDRSTARNRMAASGVMDEQDRGAPLEDRMAPVWKLVYSGDTRPSQVLEAAGQAQTPKPLNP